MNHLGILFHCRFCSPGFGVGPESLHFQNLSGDAGTAGPWTTLGAVCIMPPCIIHVSLLCCSVAKLCSTLYNLMDCSTPGSSVLYYLPEFSQIFVWWFGDAIQPSHSLLPPFSSCLNLSQHQDLFQWVCFLQQVTKVLELQHQSFHCIFELIFFRIDFFDLLAVQGTLRSLLQCNSKTSILRCSACFMVQLAHPHMTTGKIVALANMDLCQQSDVSAF